MKFVFLRILIHCSVFTLLSILTLIVPDTFLCVNAKQLFLSVISIVALCNGIGEFVLFRFARTKDKSSIFKIMIVRTSKFLCYLLLTLPLIWDRFPLAAEYTIYYGLLIVGLFFIYIFVEITYFAYVEKQGV